MSGEMTLWSRVVAVAAALLTASPAWSQQGPDPFAWEAPSVEDQLAADTTVIPLEKGAIFVPSIVGPRYEQTVLLVDAEEVTSIPTGERVLVDPGSYVVIVTSGSPGQGVGISIDVSEGETSVVPVEWGALRIEVTDERRVPHRGGYELIRADTREPYGTGFGADTLQGENLQVWLLPPGIYRIVRPGADYRTLRDWATVYVPEGGFVRYRLVTDPSTGEFRAAGVLLPEEFGSPTRPGGGRAFSSLVVGANASYVERDNVVGTFSQSQISGDVFVDGQLSWGRNGHFATTLLQVEEGVSQIRPETGDPLPLIKSRDRVRVDALYTWLPERPVGPYVRAAAETQLFRTDVLVTEDTFVVRENANGSVTTESVLANETFQVSDAFAPTIVREGAGVNTRFFNNRFLVLNWRIGLGARQNRYAGAYLLADDADTPSVEYTQVESFNQEGLESTVVANLRLPGWVTYATDLEVFAGFETLSRPSLEWRNSVSLRLTRNLSLNYYIDLDLLPQVVDAPQREQSLLLRASFALL